MDPIEIINTLTAKRVELLKETDHSKDHAEYSFMGPDEYEKGTNRRLKIISGQYHQVGKDKYIQDCIVAFLLNVQALNGPDLINGYKEAKNLVSTKYGFGPVNDVQRGERIEMAYYSQIGKYVVISSIQEFYNWYVKEFGEIVF